MIEENPSNKGKDDSKPDPKVVADIPSVPAVIPAKESSVPETAPSSPKNLASGGTGANADGKIDQTKKVLVEIVRDDSLRPFESKTLRYTKLGMVLALLTLVVFFFQFREMKQQTSTLSKQADAAHKDSLDALAQMQNQVTAARDGATAVQRQMRQDLRPYVEATCAESCKHVYSLDENQPLGMYIVITNRGKTPAENVIADFVVRKMKNGDHPQFVYSKVNPPYSRTVFGNIFPEHNSRFFAARLKPRTKTSESELLTTDDIKELTTNKFFWVVYGKVTYDDVFGVNHWTRFCTWGTEFPPDNTMVTARECTEYNGVDKNVETK